MKIGVFAKTFPGSDPGSVLAACKHAGFESAQYNMACSGLAALPQTISDDESGRVGRAALAAGVEIAAISATYNMIDPNPRRRAQGRIAFAAIAAAASNVGTRLLTVCSGTMHPQDQWHHHPDNGTRAAWREMCAEFEVVLQHASRHDLSIGVEPESANVVSSASKAARLLKEFSGTRIGIVLDPANLVENVAADRHRFVLDEAFELLGPALVLAHAKDRSADGSVVPAGKGVVDWCHFIRGLVGAGFDGHLIAHGISAGEAPAVASFLHHEVGHS